MFLYIKVFEVHSECLSASVSHDAFINKQDLKPLLEFLNNKNLTINCNKKRISVEENGYPKGRVN